MTCRTPRPPKGLGPRGRAFWRDVIGAYELDRDELELLAESCRTLDTCDQLQAVLDRDGLSVTGSTGQRRIHPGVGELRASRLALGRLLGQLALPDVDGDTIPAPASVRGRQAARARWGPVRQLHGPA